MIFRMAWRATARAMALACVFAGGLAAAQQLPAPNLRGFSLNGTPFFDTNGRMATTFFPGVTGGDITCPPGSIVCTASGKLARVANNAALALLTPTIGRVRREGFAASGDGGVADYNLTSVTCSLNSGAGDGGSQVGLTGPTGSTYIGCAILDPATYFNASVQIWGAKLAGISGDDTTAWNSAIAAMVANRGGTLSLPSAPNCSNITAPLNPITGNYVNIEGRGLACLNVNFAAGHAVQYGTSATAANGGTIRGINFQHNGTLHTSGADAAFVNASYAQAAFLTHNSGRFRGIEVDGGLDVWIDHDESVGVGQPGGSGICLGCALTSANPAGPADVRISQSNFVGATGTTASATAAAPLGTTGITGLGAGIEMQAVGGVFLDHVNTDQNQVGMWVHPSGTYTINGTTYTQQVSAIFGNGNYFDSSTRWGVLWDTSGGGQITNNRFSDYWVATCGTASQPDACVLHTGAGTQTNNRFDGAEIFNGQGPGVSAQSSSVVSTEYTGTVTGNNNVSGGAWSGFEIAAGVTHFGFHGRCGGPAGGVPASNVQKYCMNVQAGATYVVGEGDWSGNATGTVNLNNSYDVRSDFSRVVPFLPLFTYTPTIGSTGGTPPTYVVNEGRYTFKGNMVFMDVQATLTSTSGSGALTVSLPVSADSSAANATIITGRENASTGHIMLGVIGANTTLMTITDGTNNSFPGTSGYQINMSGWYPINNQ